MIQHFFSGCDFGVIYVVDSEGNLIWYKHLGQQEGNVNWENGGQGKIVGSGFFFDKMFSGTQTGIIYGITSNGDLMWYRRRGSSDGNFDWDNQGQGVKVGSGWNFAKVFSLGYSKIYGIRPNGDLLWYSHTGDNTGKFEWANNGNGQKVGHEWNMFNQVFAEDHASGVIYGIKPNGDLMWYNHYGYENGNNSWANGGNGAKVGQEWNMYERVISAYLDGIIYGVKPNGDLMWYKHLGATNGTPIWSNNGIGVKVGSIRSDGKEIW